MKVKKRIYQAIRADWGIRFFQFCEREGGRHSVHISRPKPDGVETEWYAEKVSVEPGDTEEGTGWITRLLDEAGVP